MRFIMFFIFLIAFSCQSEKQEDGRKGLLKKIKKQEQKLSDLAKDFRPGQEIPKEESDKLVDLLLQYYKKHPSDTIAPICLDKVHMIYSARKEYKKSAAYADTLIEKYPDYPNRPIVLESMATSYDLFIQPRDTFKIRKYLKLLLEENPDLPQDKREDIQFKLEHLNLTFEELIKQNSK